MTSSSQDKYYAALRAEKEKVEPLKGFFPISWKLIEEEMIRVESKLGLSNFSSILRSENVVKVTKKIPVPVEKYPEYNFVGRLLGPRGLSLKRLEHETACKIMIRGKGSMRDKLLEEEKRGKSGWEHLEEPLYILLEVETANEEEGKEVLERAGKLIHRLLVPVEEHKDLIRKSQMKELKSLKEKERDDYKPFHPESLLINPAFLSSSTRKAFPYSPFAPFPIVFEHPSEMSSMSSRPQKRVKTTSSC